MTQTPDSACTERGYYIRDFKICQVFFLFFLDKWNLLGYSAVKLVLNKSGEENMSSKLFISLSTVALLGVSTVAYGGWMWYNFDSNKKPISRPIEGKGPESDCLEMICEHGCVEKDSDFGYCCPSAGAIGDSCRVASGEDVGVCCQSGRCEDGECKPSTCTFNKKTYDDGASVPDANGCGVCHNGVVEPKEEEDCRICKMTNWRWQNVTNFTKKNDEDGTCCVNGKRQNHASLCPAPCDLDGAKYESGQAIGQCGKCQNGKVRSRSK